MRQSPGFFQATTELWASDAEVAVLASESLDKDRKVSPEGDLDYVTAIRFGVRPSTDSGVESKAWPLFGKASHRGHPSSEPVENFGFAVAAPALYLAGGDRRIDLLIQFAEPSAIAAEGSIDAYVMKRLQAFDQSGQASDAEAVLSALAGQLFQYMMLTDRLSLEPATRQRLFERLEATPELEARCAEVYAQLFDAEIDSSVFGDRLLSEAFELSLSGPEGWIVLDDVRVHRLSGDPSPSLRLSVRLSEAAPPVVGYDPDLHGNQLSVKTPVLRCLLSRFANFCAYSLFDQLELQQVTIETEVDGFRHLRVASQEAELDPTKPFTPFGARPALGSFLSFGGGELALKDLTSLKLRLRWKDLPSESGGFATYYAGYGQDVGNGTFKVGCSLLRDGQWHPAGSKDVELFESLDGGGGLAKETVVDFDDLAFWRAAAMPLISERSSGMAKDGWFRLTLTAPPDAFGHRRHPTIFAETLTDRLRSKKKAKAIPNEPYTPALHAIEVDYKARTTISIDQSRPSKVRTGEALFHIHPLGHIEILPHRRLDRNSFLPHLEFNGSLIIGLVNCRADRPLTLLFEMAEDTHPRHIKPIDAICWRVLTRDGWQRLAQERILEDTTRGLMGSGIVSLDLPDDLDRSSTSLPAGHVWLKASVNRGLDLLPSPISVRAQGIEVTECLSDEESAEESPLPASGRWQSHAHLPGITDIDQVGRSLDQVPAETDEQFQKRISERLRHKMRAVTPWDYERLVLERFPDVLKVKCFANLDPSSVTLPAPSDDIVAKTGHVLVVVIPRPQPPHADRCAGLTLDQPRLQAIQDYLRDRAPASARIEVRNPTYDRLQVRCRARFNRRQVGGAGAHRLQQDIAMYLSPWTEPGYRAAFAWTLDPKTIKGHLRDLDYVDDVISLSLLQLIETDSGFFKLNDSARSPNSYERIRPSYPWSLALPLPKHAIEEVEGADHHIGPEPTGLGDLELGRTFVIDEAR